MVVKCRMRKFKNLWIWLALFVCCLAVYSPALFGKKIWDDNFLIGQHPFFRSPGYFWDVFNYHLFMDSPSTYYRPVQIWSYMLDYLLWGENTFGYHLTNVILHTTVGFLLFLYLKCILPRYGVVSRYVPFLTAGLWVVHPMHNAAVAYISGRADALSAIFALLGLLLWEKTTGKTRWLGFAAALLLSMLSKEIGLTWLLLWALAIAPRTASWKKILTVVTLLLLSVSFLRNLPAPKERRHDASSGLEQRISLSLKALGDYGCLFVAPDRLSMERPIVAAPGTVALHRFAWFLPIGIVLAIGLSWACWQKPRAWLRFAAIWILIGFIPISNLFPLNAPSAEHWIFMPSMAAMMIVCILVPRRFYWVLLCWGLLLGARTWMRAHDWKSPARFFAQTRQNSDTLRIFLNDVMLVWDSGEHEKAIAMVKARNAPSPHLDNGSRSR